MTGPTSPHTGSESDHTANVVVGTLIVLGVILFVILRIWWSRYSSTRRDQR